ncbi:hypothetical protein [Thalassolituus maritimus]|uniref:Type 4 fimbrial biogenesis protein PilX N-terminal domain-containing protein n=1 Tax=Thalassolituus maritimus TaxID=484498 RepID=A0ABP9ZW19_9GAMM
MRLSHQQGSALIVSLIMLTSVTFLAILSLQSSTTQIKIVNNLQIKEDVFHTTKRELRKQYDGYLDDINKADELTEAFQNSAVGEVNQLLPEISLTEANVSAVASAVESLQATPVNLNFSFAKNSSVGALATMKFELTSDVQDTTAKFRSSQRLGFNYYIPTSSR